MLIDKKQLEGLSEDELRRKVLIPLFKKMGFRDVEHYHGGTGEQGKDIVMWRPDSFDNRENYAVVAKRGSISGKASGGSGSASEIANQIRQSFRDPYTDPKGTGDQKVHKCIVVASGRIPKQAIDSIKNMLSEDLTRATRFINGDELWRLIEKHMPPSALMQKLADIKSDLSDVPLEGSLDVRITPDYVSVRLEPKEGADPESLKGAFTLKFPDTEEGRAANESLKAFFDSGSAVQIPPKFVESVEFPEILKRLLGDEMTGEVGVAIGPRRGGENIPARLEISSRDGKVMSRDMTLVVEQIGAKQAVLVFMNDDSPWTARLTLEFEKKMTAFVVTRAAEPGYVASELESVRFWSAFAAGGTLTISDPIKGLILFNGEVRELKGLEPPEGWREFLEAVYSIQMKTGTPIMIPSRAISGDEVLGILQLADDLQTGAGTVKVDSVGMDIDTAGAREILNQSSTGNPMPLTLGEDQTLTVLDTPVGLGRVEYHVVALAGSQERNRIRKLLETAKEGEFHKITLECPGGVGRVVYRKFAGALPDQLSGEQTD